jgi:hypothetical protein
MADEVKVRLVMRPDEEITLKGGEQERLDLQRQGLLYEGSATTDEGARKAVEKQQADALAANQKES